MDKIQKKLIELGYKDLAQKYYKMSQRAPSIVITQYRGELKKILERIKKEMANVIPELNDGFSPLKGSVHNKITRKFNGLINNINIVNENIDELQTLLSMTRGDLEFGPVEKLKDLFEKNNIVIDKIINKTIHLEENMTQKDGDKAAQLASKLLSRDWEITVKDHDTDPEWIWYVGG